MFPRDASCLNTFCFLFSLLGFDLNTHQMLTPTRVHRRWFSHAACLAESAAAAAAAPSSPSFYSKRFRANSTPLPAIFRPFGSFAATSIAPTY